VICVPTAAQICASSKRPAAHLEGISTPACWSSCRARAAQARRPTH
jgi:hypothetical protein